MYVLIPIILGFGYVISLVAEDSRNYPGVIIWFVCSVLLIFKELWDYKR